MFFHFSLQSFNITSNASATLIWQKVTTYLRWKMSECGKYKCDCFSVCKSIGQAVNCISSVLNPTETEHTSTQTNSDFSSCKWDLMKITSINCVSGRSKMNDVSVARAIHESSSHSTVKTTLESNEMTRKGERQLRLDQWRGNDKRGRLDPMDNNDQENESSKMKRSPTKIVNKRNIRKPGCGWKVLDCQSTDLQVTSVRALLW